MAINGTLVSAISLTDAAAFPYEVGELGEPETVSA